VRYLEVVDANLAAFEPAELREQVTASWAREPTVATQEEFAEIMRDQLPFHFADPRDPRIADYVRRTEDTVYAPEVLRVFSANGYFDFATPFFETEYTLAHMGLDATLEKNISFGYYPLGHMIYLHEPALREMKADLAGFYDQTMAR